MKNLKQLKAKILEEFSYSNMGCCGGDNCYGRGDHDEELGKFLSTALDTAWEEFKGVVKMEKRQPNHKGIQRLLSVNFGNVDPKELMDYEQTRIKHYNQAIDELQEKIRKYENE